MSLGDGPTSQSRVPWTSSSSRQIYENRWIRVREDIAVLPDGQTTIYGVV